MRTAGLWLLRIGLGVLVLFTVLLCAGRLLVPQISSQQALIEAQLSRLLAVPVSIDGLAGRWIGFTPQLEVASLLVQPDNAAAARINGLSFSIDVWSSVWRRQLAIGGITVDEFELELQQNTNGRWSLAGLPAGQVDYSARIFDAVLQIPSLQLRESSLLLRPLDLPAVNLNSVFLQIRNQADSHKLQLQFRMQDQASPSQVLVNLVGSPGAQYSAQAWLGLPALDLQPLLTALDASWQVSQAQLSAELWLDFSSDGNWQLRGQARDTNLVASNLEARQINLTNAGFDLRAAHGAQGDWRMQLSNLSLDWQNSPWEVPAFLVQRPDGESPVLEIAAPSVELGMLSAIALDALPLTAAPMTALRTVNPRGEFANLMVETTVDGSMPEVFRLRGNLRDVSVDPWNAAPGGTGLDAYLELNGASGFAEVDSRDITISLPLLFASTWHYDHVNSRISWDVGAGQVHVYTPYINVDSSNLQGALAFDVLNTRDAENNLDTRFKLKVGVSTMDVLQGKVYLPSVPQVANLMNWLNESLQGGQLHNSAFIFRSSSRNGREISSMAASWYQTQGGKLQFLPDWPALENIQASVVVRDNKVEVVSNSSMIAGIGLESARAQVRPASAGSLVTVAASATTDTATGLGFLLSSPLHDTIGSTFDSWQAPAGQLAIDLLLELPVGENPAPQQIAVDVSSTGSTLSIPEYSLQFTDVSGLVRYTTAQGLQANELGAILFDNPIVASIDSQAIADSRLTTVQGQGHAGITALRDWAGQPVFISRLLGHIRGEVDYQIQLEFPGEVKPDGTSISLHLESDLRGVESELPAPFNKGASQATPLIMEYGFSAGGNADLLKLQYADLFSGLLVMDNRGIDRGQLDFGERNASFTVRQSDTSVEGLLVSGNLQQFDYDAWEAVALTLVSDDEDARGIKEALRLVDVNVEDFSLRGEHFEAINLQVEPEPQAWLIRARNSLLGGMLRIPETDSPWLVNLEYLRFPPVPERTVEEAAAAQEVDLLERVDPTQLPAFNFSTDQVSIGSSELGELRFELRPTEFGAQIRRFWMIDTDSRITGADDTQGASIDWDFRNGFHSSRFTGVFSAGDLAKVMPDWGHDVFMTSKSAHFDGSLGWPGSPLAFSVKRSSGQLDMNILAGRFVDIDSGSSRIFGAFNFDALIRRLQLDFSDLFQRGLAYDQISGNLSLSSGVITTNDSLVIDGPSSRLRINGEVNLPDETIAADMLVRIPLGQNISMLAGLLGAWPIAVSTYLASKIFADQVDEFTTLVYRLEGPWTDVDAGFEAPSSEQEEIVEVSEGQ